MEIYEILRKRCCPGPQPGIDLFANRRLSFEKSVPKKMRWEDSATSGDGYNFIPTPARELSSEKQDSEQDSGQKLAQEFARNQ